MSFSGRQFQAQYFSSKFTRRGMLLFQVLSALTTEEALQRKSISVASFGGGPGTDASGLVWLHRRFFPEQTIAVHLYDKEPTWKCYLELLRSLFSPDIDQLTFSTCDVTLSIDDAKNARVVDPVLLDVCVFAYVCNETSELSAANNFAFYRDLACRLKQGSLVIILDVMEASSPVLEKITGIFQTTRKLALLLDGSQGRKFKSEVRVFKCLDPPPSLVLAEQQSDPSIIDPDLDH